jgi:hypothetical protein
MNLQLFAEGDNQEEQNPGDNQQQDTNNDIQDKPLTMDEVRKLIQSETDKVRTEYSKRLKEAQAEVERLAKEKMSEEEKAEFERQKLQKELEEKERALLERELNLLAVNLLTEAKMPLEFKEFVVGVDEETTKAKVTTLKNLWNTALEQAVKERFKEKGRDPYDTSGSGDTVKNPWSKEHFNLTEQGRLLRENPELAKQLMANANK